MEPRLRIAEEEEVEVDSQYEGVAKDLLSKTPPQYQEALVGILNAPQTKDSYMIMRESDVPLRTIKKILLHGMEDLEKGRTVSEGAYLEAVGKELKEIDKYDDALQEMVDRGYVSEDAGSRTAGELREKKANHLRYIPGDLERITQGQKQYAPRRAAAVLFIISGLTMLLISGVSFTGNVIGGNGIYPSALFVIGLFVFIAGVVLGRK